MSERRESLTARWIRPTVIGALGALAIVAVCRMESSSADFDPQYMRVLVERTMRFGGSYYQNGIHNKGPLEPIVYEFAARVGGHDGFWLVIAVLALLASACVGLACATVAIKAEATRVVGACAGVAATVHLTLSDADYSGVLYARNMTVALLCVAFVVAASDRFWVGGRRSRITAGLLVGAALGLAVQTLLTAAFTAIPVLGWACWTRRHVLEGRLRAWMVIAAGAVVAFAVAPLWFRVVGPWDDFRDGWWVYARQMSEGTGRNVGSQISLGWDQFFAYYRERPELVVPLQVWVIVTVVRWRGLDGYQRGLRLLVAAWFAGAWMELAASQRYSSHYFSVLAVPTMLIMSVLAADVTRRWSGLDQRRHAIALALLTAIVTIQIGGTGPFGVGVETAAAVSHVSDFDDRRRAGIDGRTELVEASLDLVSAERDPLLVWTSYPWPYLNLRRVSATRFIWKSFLMGEIYLGNTGSEYVLEGTWDRFLDDVEQTDPPAFYVEHNNPVAPGTPFETVVDAGYTTIFDDDTLKLSFRNDLTRWIVNPVDGAQLLDSIDSVPLGCRRVDATVVPSTDEPLRLRFINEAGESATIEAAVTGDGTFAFTSQPWRRSPFVVNLAPGSAASIDVSLLVGGRAVGLVVEGRIVGAVKLPDGSVSSAFDGVSAWQVGELRSVPMPTWAGCE